jgi:hypothetical protein
MGHQLGKPRRAIFVTARPPVSVNDDRDGLPPLTVLRTSPMSRPI